MLHSKIWTDAGEGVMYSTLFAPLNEGFKNKMKDNMLNKLKEVYDEWEE